MRMPHAVALFACCALLVSSSVSAENLLVSGSTALFIIDGNGNGPGAGDCQLTATRNLGTVTLTPVQDTTTPLALCATTFTGSSFAGSDSSSDFVGFDFTSSAPPVPTVPFRVELVDEPTPNGLPATLDNPFPTDAVTLFDLIDPSNPKDRGAGALCSIAGAIALIGRDHRDVRFLFDATLFPNATSPTHLCIQGLAFETTMATAATLNAYVPVTSSKTLTLAGSDTPNSPLISIDLANLPLCGAGPRNAPSLTVWGLALTLAALLAAGTWSVSRRRGFYTTLTLP